MSRGAFEGHPCTVAEIGYYLRGLDLELPLQLLFLEVALVACSKPPPWNQPS